jgi:hypothetical protein
MRPSLLASTLESLFKLRRPVLIEGSPGIGKTSIPKAVANRLGWQYIERHPPLMLVEDFGIPKLGTDVIEYVLPWWYPAKGSRWDNGTPGVLCFDDMAQGSADLQKVVANIIQARELHGAPMSDDWTVVMTGNRVEDRAGANKLLSHFRNRLTAINMEVSPQDWHEWASAAGVHLHVRSFLRWKESMLNKFDPAQQANPTPRQWAEAISPQIGVILPEAELETFAGSIGEGAAIEFVAFSKVMQTLPSLDAAILNPKTAALPTELSARYAVTLGLVDRVTPNTFDNIVTYMRRLVAADPASGMDRPVHEFMILFIKEAMKRHPQLHSTNTFTTLMVDYQKVMS